jgi:4-hydroxy-tetrahydrodipicolinate synthase
MSRIKQASLMTAIKTPYLPNRSFDLEAFDRLVDLQIKSGVQGLIVGGTTGEGQLMGWDEHIMLIAHCVHKYSDQMVIVGNTGSNNTYEAIRATEQGFAVGMDAALQINPYYGKTSPEGIIAHFGKVLDIGPCIIYNVPARTGQDVPPEIMESLAKNINLVGIKECMGTERIKYYETHGIACWSGNDDQSHDSRHEGRSHGVISVAANVIPKTMRKLMDSPQPELNKKLKVFFDWLFCEPNPIPLNTIMPMLGLAKPVFRLPYVPLNLDQREKGLQLFNDLNLDELVTDIQNLPDDQYIYL